MYDEDPKGTCPRCGQAIWDTVLYPVARPDGAVVVEHARCNGCLWQSDLYATARRNGSRETRRHNRARCRAVGHQTFGGRRRFCLRCKMLIDDQGKAHPVDDDH